MAIITAGYVDRAIGTATRIAFVGTATGTGSAFAQHEAAARSIVASRAQVKGYAIGTSSDNAFVQLLVLGQWYWLAGGMRKGLEVPPAIGDAMAKLDEVAPKDSSKAALPIPGMTPSTDDGIGGSQFSQSIGTSSTDRVQYFSRSKMQGW